MIYQRIMVILLRGLGLLEGRENWKIIVDNYHNSPLVLTIFPTLLFNFLFMMLHFSLKIGFGYSCTMILFFSEYITKTTISLILLPTHTFYTARWLDIMWNKIFELGGIIVFETQEWIQYIKTCILLFGVLIYWATFGRLFEPLFCLAPSQKSR